jgi:hypothetical protein
MTKRKYKTYKMDINYWFVLDIFLTFILLILLLFLIQERQLLAKMDLDFDKYKAKIDNFSSFNAQIINSHLSSSTTPFSLAKIIYIGPESFSLR